MRILAVDDSEDSRAVIEAVFMSVADVNVMTASSASEAYDILRLWRTARMNFDVVLLDINMPKIGGIEACARIREDAYYANLPIVMLTALAGLDSLTESFVAGATDYITKPFTREKLVARVQSAVKAQRKSLFSTQ